MLPTRTELTPGSCLVEIMLWLQHKDAARRPMKKAEGLFRLSLMVAPQPSKAHQSSPPYPHPFKLCPCSCVSFSYKVSMKPQAMENKCNKMRSEFVAVYTIN